jgi:DNA repair exonuclease SbcCD ATPase subunit
MTIEEQIASIVATLQETSILTKENSAQIEKNSAAIEKNSAAIEKNSAQIAELSKTVAAQGEQIFALQDEMRIVNAKLDANNAKLDENNAKLDANNAKLDENNAKLDKVTADLERNNSLLGALTNKMGEIVEVIVAPGIVDKFDEIGLHFDKMLPNVKLLNDDGNGNLAEVDILLENGTCVVAVETKTDLEHKYVAKHIQRLKNLRKLDRFQGKAIYGAMTTAVKNKRDINYALRQGLYVLSRPDVMKVAFEPFPEGCAPKAW